MLRYVRAGALIWATVAIAPAHAQTASDPYASAQASHTALRRGTVSSEALVRESQNRIRALDHEGPRLNAVIALNPRALAEARSRDIAHRSGHGSSALDGVPILLKDNIETDNLPTTAGSLALKDNVTGRNAP
ncbi:MAG: amidase, partial [Brevundimonas sp.]